MNELVTNSLGGASPVLNHKCSQKSEVDWTVSENTTPARYFPGRHRDCFAYPRLLLT